MKKIDYAILAYDIEIAHTNYATFYAALRARLARTTMPYTMSVRLLNLAQVVGVTKDIDELHAHYGVPIEYKVRRMHPHEAEALREDSRHAFIKQIKHATKELTRQTDELSRELERRKIDKTGLYKGRQMAIRKAERLLREGRGLAIMFQIEQDTSNVLDSLKRIIAAERVIQGELKAKLSASPVGV